MYSILSEGTNALETSDVHVNTAIIFIISTFGVLEHQQRVKNMWFLMGSVITAVLSGKGSWYEFKDSKNKWWSLKMSFLDPMAR